VLALGESRQFVDFAHNVSFLSLVEGLDDDKT
jgi:hypothetical protein